MKKQIVIIHGGHALDANEDFLLYLQNKKIKIEDFKLKHKWKEIIIEKLNANFEFFYPQMPNKESAKYEEWKIWFEKIFPFLGDDITLIGHSLGGLFLIKYLSENVFPKKIKSLITIAAPYEGRDRKHIRNHNFFLTNDFSKVTEQAKKIYLLHSKDDTVVPFTDFELFKEKLPNAETITFDNKGHFSEATFPELIEILKELYQLT